METALDLSRWREKPGGVAYRRWTIVSTGLRQLLRGRFFRILLIVAWAACLLMGTMGFLFTQTVTTGGWLETSAANFGARAQAIASAVGAMILLYPDICVRGVFSLMFWLQSFVGYALSMIALTLLVPHLIARDRASNALTVYLSRPLTSVDYLLGKLGIVVGVLVLLWTGPLLVGWGLSMLLSPDRDFMLYSLSPLARALAFNAISLVVLAALALGVSALNRSSRNTIIVWIALWLIAGTIAKTPEAPTWIRRSSFSYGLSEVRKNVFQLDEILLAAGKELPLLDARFSANLTRAGKDAESTDLPGALGGLGLIVVLSSVVFLRKLRPE